MFWPFVNKYENRDGYKFSKKAAQLRDGDKNITPAVVEEHDKIWHLVSGILFFLLGAVFIFIAIKSGFDRSDSIAFFGVVFIAFAILVMLQFLKARFLDKPTAESDLSSLGRQVSRNTPKNLRKTDA